MLRRHILSVQEHPFFRLILVPKRPLSTSLPRRHLPCFPPSSPPCHCCPPHPSSPSLLRFLSSERPPRGTSSHFHNGDNVEEIEEEGEEEEERDDDEKDEYDLEDIEDMLSKHGVQSQRRSSNGDAFVCVKECPFCHDIKNDESNMWKLGISPSKGAFHCFRCEASGNIASLPARLTEALGEPEDDKLDNAEVLNTTRTATDSTSLKEYESHQKKTGLDYALSSLACYEETLERNLVKAHFQAFVRKVTEERGINLATLQLYRCGMERVSFNGQLKPSIFFPLISAPGEFSSKGNSSKSRSSEGEGNDSALVLYKDEAEWSSKLELTRVKVRDVEKKVNQKTLRASAQSQTGFFGWHTVSPDSPYIIVTEGEYDAMAVYQATGHPTVSLPNGANALLPELINALRKFEVVYLWLDQDEIGQTAAEKLAKKLGYSKCRRIPMCADVKDANDALLMGRDLNKYFEKAERFTHQKLLTMAQMFPKLEAYLENPPSKGIPFKSLPGLTTLLKGHRKGELTVFTGPTGVGKTTLLSQLSIDLAVQGVSTLWGSFEIKNERLMHTMLHQFSAFDAKRPCSIPDSPRVDLSSRKREFFELPLSFLDFFGATQLQDVLDTMEAAVEAGNVDHVVIDNLQFMMSDFSNVKRFTKGVFERIDEMDFAVSCFRRFASNHNIHVTVVIHPRKEAEGERLTLSSFYGSGKATQEADNVLILQAPKGINKSIEIKKNRFDGTQGDIQLGFSPPHKLFYDVSKYGLQQRQLESSPLGRRSSAHIADDECEIEEHISSG